MTKQFTREWVTNTVGKPASFDFVAWGDSREKYDIWRRQFVEGPPKATAAYSVEDLERIGMIRLYRKVDASMDAAAARDILLQCADLVLEEQGRVDVAATVETGQLADVNWDGTPCNAQPAVLMIMRRGAISVRRFTHVTEFDLIANRQAFCDAIKEDLARIDSSNGGSAPFPELA